MIRRILLVGLVVLFLVSAGLYYLANKEGRPLWSGRDTFEVERTDYNPPPPADDGLADDRLEDKQPPAFDPARADRRPLGEWLVNNSAALFRLDVPIIKSDAEPDLLVVHPSYATAVKAAHETPVLPSVNLIDGKAKQFDDGLYAALDQAYYRGLDGKLQGHVQLVRRLSDKLPKDSPAAPFLAAGLRLAGVTVAGADRAAVDRLLAAFEANEVKSKPIGFYTWNETLTACFRFLRLFQHEWSGTELPAAGDLARVLAADPALAADYRRAVTFYARLTNPHVCLSVLDLVGRPATDAEVARLAKENGAAHATVALFPPSTSRETVLFEKLFPLGLPPDADLMRELVRRIRSGEVHLQPGPDSGWYDYQAYALETLLLPEKGEERNKLLLTKAYKKRMLEAFQALITKRRETHVRQVWTGVKTAAPPPPPPNKVKPRFRLEPNPTYYLRTARAYDFLTNVLEAAVGPEALRGLHGLRQGGERPQDLHGELRWMRDLFYGCYLTSAEDIGLAPAFAAGEKVDAEHCRRLAEDWLSKALGDPDLAADTRVAVPVMVDVGRPATRLWLTLGVRLAKLDAAYVKPPSLKPAQGPGAWQEVEPHRLESATYLIPVDEFAEVERPGLRVLTRDELRAVCDREKTREAILQALRK